MTINREAELLRKELMLIAQKADNQGYPEWEDLPERVQKHWELVISYVKRKEIEARLDELSKTPWSTDSLEERIHTLKEQLKEAE